MNGLMDNNGKSDTPECTKSAQINGRRKMGEAKGQHESMVRMEEAEVTKR
jgi:hypothetical protein